jgi:hypothetical protein
MYMLILNFTYPLRCLRVPPVEYHWDRRLGHEVKSPLAHWIGDWDMRLSKEPTCPLDRRLGRKVKVKIPLARWIGGWA